MTTIPTPSAASSPPPPPLPLPAAAPGDPGSGSAASSPAPPPSPSPPPPPGASGRPKSRVPLISAVAVACVAAVLIAILATSKSASETGSLAVTPLQNKPAPNIAGTTLNGGSASLSAYKGKWVLLNFFASWCVPCQQEQPELVKFQNAHPSDAVIFGVRFDDPDLGPIKQLMSQSGAKWPIVDNANAKIVYSVTGPPESFLVSPGGVVLVHIIGPTTDAQLESILHQEELVVSTPAAPSSTSTP